MWIFAKGIGFLSIVESDDDNTEFCVRARKREHLVKSFPTFEEDIIETPDGDYRWRILVDRSIVMDLIVEELSDIDYKTNVKGTIAGDDKELGHAMMTCWGAMCRYQDGGRYGSDHDEVEDWLDSDDDDEAGDWVGLDDSEGNRRRVPTMDVDELSSAVADAVAGIGDDFPE